MNLLAALILNGWWPVVGAGATLWDGLEDMFQDKPTTKLPPVPLPGKNDNWKSGNPVITPEPEEIIITGESKGCGAVPPSAADLPGAGVSSFAPQTFEFLCKPLISLSRKPQIPIRARLHS